jgi:hypothetical protein
MACNGRCCYIYGHLVYFTAICYILWPFGIFGGNLVYFSPFWYIVPKKSGNPALMNRFQELHDGLCPAG